MRHHSLRNYKTGERLEEWNYDVANGDGIGLVFWAAGCEHACPGCHNPETQDPKRGDLFDEHDKQKLFRRLSENYVKRLAFSGGDPLFPANREEVFLLAQEVKQKFPNKKLWLWTGYLWENIRDLPIIPLLDVLVDGRFVQAKHSKLLRYAGSSNQRIIDVQKTLEKGEIVLYFDNQKILKKSCLDTY